MAEWFVIAWLWLLSGFLVWRQYADNTGERKWSDVLGLLLVGAPIVTAKIAVEAFRKVVTLKADAKD